MQRSQHDDGSDGGAGKFRGDIGRDSGEAQYVDLQHLPGATRLLEILAAIIPQTEVYLFRAVDCLTTSAWRSSWFRIAVRMKSVRLE